MIMGPESFYRDLVEVFGGAGDVQVPCRYSGGRRATWVELDRVFGNYKMSNDLDLDILRHAGERRFGYCGSSN